MQLRRGVRIGSCGAFCLLAACAVPAPDDVGRRGERAQASALTNQTLLGDDDFTRAVAETFPNDEFAADYVAEIITEDEVPSTVEKSIVGSSSTTLERTSTSTSYSTQSYGKDFFHPGTEGDTTCDREDDDEDGEVDEDCDFGPEDCPAGTNLITGTGGSDWLWGTSLADCILGYGGRDVLIGLDGHDWIVGGPGDDAIRGSRGDDVLRGGADDDLVYGDDGNDQVSGDEGNDALIGAKGNDKVNGGACHDLVLANSGTDALYGNDGSDRIDAGAPHGIDGGGGIDACNGASCELSAFAGLCLWDWDCGPGEGCTRLSHICVSTAAVAFTDPTCDGFDDDCDGRADEEYASAVVACPCGGSGTTTCVDGEEVDDCSGGGGGGGGPDATCDGVDDDCDTQIDEDYLPTATSCGVGGCSANGLLLCSAGAPVDSCTPLPPAADDASCNAIDDDCNGTADEDYVATATSCGVGACGASGVLACTGGSVADSCTPGAPAPNDASCNAIDDDCSGAADEDYLPTATSCNVGGCLREGALQCNAGLEQDSCSSSPCVAESACEDDLDNDGDLAVDCDDPDCSSVPICSVQPFSTTVVGAASLWGAGHPVPPGGGALPPGIIIALGPGAVLKFTGISGSVNQAGANLPPDGTPGIETLPNSADLAGFTHGTLTRSLAGVFLGDGPPVGPPPPQLAFADGNFSELAPGLHQIFFIGDGNTGAALQQRFLVPAGATRLFLGLTDRCGGNIPGCFGDNFGSYSVSGEFSFD